MLLPLLVSVLASFGGLILLPSKVYCQVELPPNYDPVQNFCHRFGHQTAVIKDRLFIDGGYLNMVNDSRNYTNPYLHYLDLTSNANSGMPPIHTNLAKSDSVPVLTGGTLWPDSVNEKLYLYGGRFISGIAKPFELWMYDASYDMWSVVNHSLIDAVPSRVYNGASAVAEDQALGYYLGGWIDSESQYDWQADRMAVSNLLVYNMEHNTWRTESGPGDVPRAEGVMVYIPAGDNGLLIAFGGIVVPDGNLKNATGASMAEIWIYNVAAPRWYQQTAIGDIPESRRLFCAGVATTRINNSLINNIYIYGGASTPSSPDGKEDGFDDVYILSLPTFTWTKWWPDRGDDYLKRLPHNSLSCNVIHNSQMLIIGGHFPRDKNFSQCDVIPNLGVHNLDLSELDNRIWKDYSPSLTTYNLPTNHTIAQQTEVTYSVPTTVAITAFASDLLGIITITVVSTAVSTAKVSYGHADLSSLLTRSATPTNRTATRILNTSTSSPDAGESSGLSKEAIIGIAVGAGVILLFLLVFCFVLFRRRRAGKRTQAPTPSDYVHPPQAAAEETQQIKRPFLANIFSSFSSQPSQPHIPGAVSPGIDSNTPSAFIRDPTTGALIPVYDQPVAPLSPRLNSLSLPSQVYPSHPGGRLTVELEHTSSQGQPHELPTRAY